MISDYELTLPHQVEVGHWIKTATSPRPALVLNRHDSKMVIANFDEAGRPTSGLYNLEWDMLGVPIPRLSTPYIHLGNAEPISDEWISPFALVMYEPSRGGEMVFEPMMKVDQGDMRDAVFYGLRTNSRRSYSPSHHAPIHEFRLWASKECRDQGEAPLIHYRG